MELMVKRPAVRFKKYLLLLVAIPIVLGILGWVIPVGKEKSLYTAEATITLGSYGNKELNDPSKVVTLLTNPPFYQENLPGLWGDNQINIASKLQVINIAVDQIKLSYTDHSKDKAVLIVNEITKAFLHVDQQKFNEKNQLIQETIDTLKQEKVSDDTRVDQQKFIYDLSNARLDLRQAIILQPADSEKIMIANKAFNSKERAVLGGLIGITIALIFIVIPEFLREQSN